MTNPKQCGFCRFSSVDEAEFDRHLWEQHRFVPKGKPVPETPALGRLVTVPMTRDVARLSLATRQRRIQIWSIAALVALFYVGWYYFLRPVFNRQFDYSPSQALGVIFLIVVVLGLAAVFVLRSIRAAITDTMPGQTITWVVGTFDVCEEWDNNGRHCELIAGETKLDIDCAVFDKVRPDEAVIATEKGLFGIMGHRRFSLTGAAQFVPNVKLLRIISAGRVVYEHPGLTPDSGVPPS